MLATELGGEVVGGGFAFGGGGGGEDDLVGLGGAGVEGGETEVLGAYAVDRGEGAVEDVVDAGVGAGFFDGGYVGGLLEDAEEALVADGVGAVDAGVDVGDVVAEGAEAQVGLELSDGEGEGVGIGGGGTEDVEGQALGGLRAYSGELAELLDEARHGFGEAGHFSW